MNDVEDVESTEAVEENVQTGVGMFDEQRLDAIPPREKGQPEPTGFSSAPDPRTQSGVPLDEDKAKGVKPGDVPKPPEAPEVASTP